MVRTAFVLGGGGFGYHHIMNLAKITEADGVPRLDYIAFSRTDEEKIAETINKFLEATDGHKGHLAQIGGHVVRSPDELGNLLEDDLGEIEIELITSAVPYQVQPDYFTLCAKYAPSLFEKPAGGPLVSPRVSQQLQSMVDLAGDGMLTVHPMGLELPMALLREQFEGTEYMDRFREANGVRIAWSSVRNPKKPDVDVKADLGPHALSKLPVGSEVYRDAEGTLKVCYEGHEKGLSIYTQQVNSRDDVFRSVTLTNGDLESNFVLTDTNLLNELRRLNDTVRIADANENPSELYKYSESIGIEYLNPLQGNLIRALQVDPENPEGRRFVTPHSQMIVEQKNLEEFYHKG